MKWEFVLGDVKFLKCCSEQTRVCIYNRFSFSENHYRRKHFKPKSYFGKNLCFFQNHKFLESLKVYIGLQRCNISIIKLLLAVVDSEFSIIIWKQLKRMQRPGNEAIRTQIHPSKPKREIIKITNSQNTKRTYGQPRSYFPKTGHSATQPKLKIILTRHRNSDTKTGNREPQLNYILYLGKSSLPTYRLPVEETKDKVPSCTQYLEALRV